MVMPIQQSKQKTVQKPGQRPATLTTQRPSIRSASSGVSAFRKAMQQTSKTVLVDRVSEAYDTKEESGKYRIYLKDLPIPLWKPKNGVHIVDFIPFLSGGMDPNPKIKEGDITYRVVVYVHSKVGCTEDRVICLARTYGKPCPICEWINKQYQGDPETIDTKYLKSIDAKRRVIYNVLIHGDDAAQGVHVFEASHYLVDTKLSTIARNKRTGTFYPFFDPDKGQSIGFEKTGEGIGTKYDGFERIDRDAPISDEVLDQAAKLDLHLEVLTYQQLKDKFYDAVEDADDEEDSLRDAFEEVTDFDDDDLPIVEEADFEDIPY